MKYFFIILASWNIFIIADAQKIHYANRFIHFSLTSETGDIHLINVTIIQDGLDHVFMGSTNLTRDVRLKNIIVVVHRCSFEKADCENFMEWKFPAKDLKHVMYMKNQLWTPTFANVSPNLNFPVMKKGIYRMNKVTIDAKAALTFYPDAYKYYWRGLCQFNDLKDRKAISLILESTFFIFIDRGRKRERKSSTLKPINVV